LGSPPPPWAVRLHLGQSASTLGSPPPPWAVRLYLGQSASTLGRYALGLYTARATMCQGAERGQGFEVPFAGQGWKGAVQGTCLFASLKQQHRTMVAGSLRAFRRSNSKSHDGNQHGSSKVQRQTPTKVQRP
jgi:hypothetical protein